jgi:hypothetical protein
LCFFMPIYKHNPVSLPSPVDDYAEGHIPQTDRDCAVLCVI